MEANPTIIVNVESLTLRDLFAMTALPWVLGAVGPHSQEGFEIVAERAYRVAEAMMCCRPAGKEG